MYLYERKQHVYTSSTHAELSSSQSDTILSPCGTLLQQHFWKALKSHLKLLPTTAILIYIAFGNHPGRSELHGPGSGLIKAQMLPAAKWPSLDVGLLR